KSARLIDKLESRGAFITEKAESEIVRFDARGEVAGDREVWAVAELMNGELRQVSYELLGKGIELARKLKARLAAVVLGADVGSHVEALAAHGASRVYVADDERLARYSTFDYTSVLVGSTSNGRDLAPRIAARLSLGLTADCIDLDIDEGGDLIQYKPAFGGNIVALIYSKTIPRIATVKPGMLRAAPADELRKAEVIRIEIPQVQDLRARLIDVRREVSLEVAELDEAQTVICVGTGIGGPENLAAIDELARALDARIGATRRVVDQGWLPRHQQIGLTGKVISPALYIAIGVR